MSKQVGAMLVFIGGGTFVLPFFGLQFKVMNLLGTAGYVIAFFFLILGLLVLWKC